MGYKVEKPEGAPEWFVSGIVCNVWNSKKDNSIKCVVVWYSNELYFDAGGCAWSHAEPIESWTPKEGEWVAAWQAEAKGFIVTRYKNGNDGDFVTSSGYWDHIARITDGLDLRCTPEELKERTEWL